MNINSTKKQFAKQVIQHLLAAHRRFQEQLDLITLTNNSKETIEPLIDIRAFNVDCLTRYSDIIAKSGIHLLGAEKRAFDPTANAGSEALWQINNELSKLLPTYYNALKTRGLNNFTRMTIAQNLDKIVYIKDNLLHPLPKVETV